MELADLLKNAPVKRAVVIDGEPHDFWFRLLTAAERLTLLHGKKYAVSNGQSTVEIDLAQNEREKQQYVFFTTCTEEGKPYFDKQDTVKKLAAPRLDAIYEAAKAVNSAGEDDDAGKD